MTQTNALRQKHYRQRLALSRLRNEYTVTLMLKQCALADVDIWPVIEETVDVIFKHNGDALEFVRRIATLVYAAASIKIIKDKLRSQAGDDRVDNGQ